MCDVNDTVRLMIQVLYLGFILKCESDYKLICGENLEGFLIVWYVVSLVYPLRKIAAAAAVAATARMILVGMKVVHAVKVIGNILELIKRILQRLWMLIVCDRVTLKLIPRIHLQGWLTNCVH
ncbi:Hypothetical predicted protein [Olea europaea subsp. europaea]|uniref:Uncharacterized protein n=1 Tax=Olea europaea subsp. europaea TaxID=158383 RepID=A0A8S0T326_OLEEU|nr:Hypothetical predicted protein [Olea europaea subsp. europaea]